MPVVTYIGGTLKPGAEYPISTVAVMVAPDNSARKKLIIQNTGVGNVRIGDSTVTSSSGVKLIPNGSMILEMPDVPQNAIYAIRDGGVDSVVFSQDIV